MDLRMCRMILLCLFSVELGERNQGKHRYIACLLNVSSSLCNHAWNLLIAVFPDRAQPTKRPVCKVSVH